MLLPTKEQGKREKYVFLLFLGSSPHHPGSDHCVLEERFMSMWPHVIIDNVHWYSFFYFVQMGLLKYNTATFYFISKYILDIFQHPYIFHKWPNKRWSNFPKIILQKRSIIVFEFFQNLSYYGKLSSLLNFEKRLLFEKDALTWKNLN